MTITAGTFTGDSRRAGAVPAVSFANVNKSYGTVRAVADLDLQLYPGETVALLGPNGAGKSTTLDLLLGLSQADSGTVELFGTTPQRALEQGMVGAMLQSGGLMEDVRVRELVRLACDLHPRAYPVDRVMEQAGITEIADRLVNKLSGGQEQRVRFALATAGANDLIVLDEPTTGMDVTSRQTFWGAMRRQADEGRAVLFATHYLEEADAIADRVIVLHRGRILADGSAAEIKAKAGARRIVFDLDGQIPQDALRSLPMLAALEVSGRTVRIQSHDADATVHALYGLGLYPRNLEVAGLGLEQAFIAITDAATAGEAVSS
ncbi:MULTISPECIES: ABC transporter ATP-binding protein [Streptomyces]|uniref:ABC transporter ATP-binding protein n=1 Tax=Streptomyces TaxID=1883 RepID=UPI00163C3E16|nr:MULTISPECIES: ABC transporter ATP-binding protein [Streptomyces]MBC2875155.1 ABC transporter ATP-binding protein [Streptomyces sp. TYQ1024]UBI36988.1 ABC transporter ATP-binding protein [Streptomyces mobaraensis]UKW29581.1 ABC transporter ATP-binding protein [Streptomyces sp. TYQ1024]